MSAFTKPVQLPVGQGIEHSTVETLSSMDGPKTDQPQREEEGPRLYTRHIVMALSLGFIRCARTP